MSKWKRFRDELPEVGRYILRAYKDERGRVKYYWQYIEELEEL